MCLAQRLRDANHQWYDGRRSLIPTTARAEGSARLLIPKMEARRAARVGTMLVVSGGTVDLRPGVRR
jgi:hypothetical protein